MFALFLCLSLLSNRTYAQALIQNFGFKEVTQYEGSVVFIKEIELNQDDLENSYTKLNKWAKGYYTTDPIITNIRYDNKNQEVIVKSKIELLLPANSENIREKVRMTYHLNTFIYKNKCIIEINDITYTYPNGTKIKAENVIASAGLASDNMFKSMNERIKLSTLYFFNELADNIDNAVTAN